MNKQKTVWEKPTLVKEENVFDTTAFLKPPHPKVSGNVDHRHTRQRRA